jgi:hypothetical protein
MDQCVKGMQISVVVELFLIVCPLPRVISKWVSREQDDYLNCND